MLSVTLSDLKNDIKLKMRGTSLAQIGDFYDLAATAANRMLARVDTEETRRTMTLTSPLYVNLNDYALPTDFKRAIDLHPTQKSRGIGNSNFSLTSPRQFSENLAKNSISIGWNSGVRVLRAQIPCNADVTVLDEMSSPTSNGLWTATGDSALEWDESITWDEGNQVTWDNGLFTNSLNFINGNGSIGFNLTGATGVGGMVNSTASPIDLSTYNYQDASLLYFYIPSGFSSRFTSFSLTRGDDANDYVTVTITAKAGGTAFTDGWNLLLFDWNLGTATGEPSNTVNSYRVFTVNYTTGSFIKGCLVDSWSNSLGQLYDLEYYSECLFRTAAGAWEYEPTADTDFINVGPASYEILKTEMMVDITQIIRQGAVRNQELADWRLMLNGQPQSRYVKDPPYHGLYMDYEKSFPSSAIITQTQLYEYDV